MGAEGIQAEAGTAEENWMGIVTRETRSEGYRHYLTTNRYPFGCGMNCGLR